MTKKYNYMRNNLKIINVHVMFSPYGGGEVVAYNTYKVLKQHGHEVYYFAMDDKPYFEENYEFSNYFCENIQKNNIIDYLINIPRTYYNYKSLNKFREMLDDIKPDIVHVHTVGKLTYSILKACFERNIPVVKTEHSALIACPSESLFYQNKTFCKKKYCIKGNYFHCIKNKCYNNNLYSSIVSALLNFVNDFTRYNNKIARFISPSLALKEIIVEKGIPNNKIKVIANFFDNNFKNLPINNTQGNYFLYSGRLYNFKGVRTLVETISTLPKEIQFHIVGKGPMEEELKKYCKVNKLENVKFLGFLSQEQLMEEYSNCIATIVPSICFEIFGLIVIETMAFGKPVIVSDIGALPEIIKNNETGLIFKPENPKDLKEKILTYWKNKDLAIKHGKNAHKIANELYTEDKYYEKLINLYSEVLNEK